MNEKKILIADDDQEHLLMLAFMLRKAGYQVISAFDAKSALQLAVEQAPDLLLIDIHLGNEDGFSIQKRLRKIEELAATPVIYLSGDKSNMAQHLSDAVGGHALIGKPFNTEYLMAEIKIALGRETGPPVAPQPADTLVSLSAETFIG